MSKNPQRLLIGGRPLAGTYAAGNSMTNKALGLLPLVAILFLALALGLSTMSCSKGGDQAQGGQKGSNQMAKAGGGKGGRGGEGRPKQPPIPIAVADAKQGSIASYYTTTATLTAEKQAEILARSTGVALTLHCEEGDWVKEGQTLLKIEDQEYRLRLAQAAANKRRLKDKFERTENMWKQKMVSVEEFQTAENEFKAAEAAEGLAELELSYTTVVAPFTGRVVTRHVDIGQNINAGTPLFVISDFDPLLAEVYVPSKEFRKLKPDQPVRLTLDSNKQRLDGRIKLVSPIIDPTTGTIKVTVEIREYPEGTRPGDFAEVSIVTERHHDSTIVPKIAVFTDRGDQIVYIAVADSTAERRVVEVGFEDDDYAEILDGGQLGEQIIVKGQRSLKHGAPIKIMNDGDDAPALPAAATPTAQRAGS
jgi:membrane fusion protein (multidrug efflux system)